MNPPPRALLLAALAAALGGCASQSQTTAQPASAQATVYDWQQLQPGLTSFEVELLVGKPRKVRENPKRNGEIWIYERLVGTRVDPVAARIDYEMWIDPIDNQIKPIPVPKQGLQRTDRLEIVEIEVIDGICANLERTTVSRRSFTD
jgi:hypothetical protein